MQNSKLISLYHRFSNSEIKNFKKYTSSSFFNENKYLETLLEYINKHADEDEKLSKEEVYPHIYPAGKYDDLKIRHLMADLLKLMQDFIAYNEHIQNAISPKINLLSSLRRNELNKHYESIFRNAKSSHEQHSYRDSDFYYNQFKLEWDYNKYLEEQNKRTKESNLQLAADNLDAFYLINKLKFCCEMINFKNVVDVDHEILLIGEILSHIKSHSYEHIPAIEIYYNIFMTLTDSGNEEHYSKLKDMLDKYIDKFTPEEARDMYTYALNFCIKKINTGNLDYLREIFIIYQAVLEKKLIFVRGHLPPWDFKNIIIVALRLQDYNWVEDFINSYKDKIAPEYRENAYTYNLAKLHFHKRDYSKVIKLLQKVEYDDVFYSLDSRATLLKTYYEVDDFEALYSLIDSFRIFLRRNKLVSEHHKTNYLNLVKFVKKASRIIPGDEKKIRQLRKDIEEVKQIADIKWLQEKVEELQ